MKKQKAIAISILAILLMSGCRQKDNNYVEVSADIADSFPLTAEPAENPQLAESDGPYAVLHTTAGDITILLYPEQAPKAVENFISLAKEGYYDGTIFHFVRRDEFAQTGKPINSEGEEDRYAEERSKWTEPFEDEFDDGLHHFPGAVGMYQDGYNNNLSQFYLVTKTEKAEDERVIPANLYMNELVRKRMLELNEMGVEKTLTEDEIKDFEADLNEEIQAIADGVPKEAAKRYEPALEQYRLYGGAWALDYKYTVFGQIVEGLNVAEAVTQVKVEAANRKPKKDVVIESIEIRE